VLRDRADTSLVAAGRSELAPSSSSSALERLAAGGTDGNERLTTVTGAVLLVGLAALGITVVRNRQLLNEHMFLGMLLIGPVALKMGSTGYRFLRYYTHEPRYRRKGPPELAMRLLAPLLVLSTVVVFASGVALMFIGPSSRPTLYPIHKISFFVWLAAFALHVLGHLFDLQRVLAPSASRIPGLDEARAGRDGRTLALGGVLVAGVVLAIVSIPQFAPWANAHFPHH
jgi:membrane protein required for beta-lactamase induction